MNERMINFQIIIFYVLFLVASPLLNSLNNGTLTLNLYLQFFLAVVTRQLSVILLCFIRLRQRVDHIFRVYYVGLHIWHFYWSKVLTALNLTRLRCRFIRLNNWQTDN